MISKLPVLGWLCWKFMWAWSSELEVRKTEKMETVQSN